MDRVHADHVVAEAGTVNSLCDNCFAYQKLCPYIESSLLRGMTAVRMQLLVINDAVLTSSVLTTRVYCTDLEGAEAKSHMPVQMQIVKLQRQSAGSAEEKSPPQARVNHVGA